MNDDDYPIGTRGAVRWSNGRGEEIERADDGWLIGPRPALQFGPFTTAEILDMGGTLILPAGK